ncbi:hypothetical protein CHS0354_035690 [Potamilus streckersoni]|uniref:RRM domain-containing protein n=1 Tax=Potamilus streckersoni TaxID=2493646 RepID=A0AAE0VQB2_9BIVA|nr:hypothetical protein CHS0354_035690 [Potamilus streckersoni]
MAAQAGKKKKAKGKTMALTDFLSDEHGKVQAPVTSYVLANKSVDWASEVEKLEADDPGEMEYGKHMIDRSKLPTAPKASRGPDVDLSRVPTSPPFTAFIGNLPYEANEEKITHFFRNQKVLNVRLPEENGRLRGFGYVEFEDRESLLDAIALNEETLNGRKIRVDLASQNQQNQDRDGARRDDKPDRTEGDWRRREPGSDSFGRGDRGSNDDRYGDRNDRFGDRGGDRSDRFGDRGGDRGDRFGDRGGDRGDRFGDRGGDRSDRFGDKGGDRGDRYGDRPSDRGGDRYGDRDRGGGRYNDRSGGFSDRGWRDGEGGDRRYNRGFDDRAPRDRGFGGRYEDRGGPGGRDRQDGFSDDRGGDDRGGPGGRRAFGSGFRDDQDKGFRETDNYRREDRPDRPPSRNGPSSRESSKDAPKERPRLQLQPRSKPLENDATQSGRNTSIFGGAKPVDTLSRELAIEERLRREKESEVQRSQEEDRNIRNREYSSGTRPRADSGGRSQEGRRERRLSSGSSSKGRAGPPPVTSQSRSRRDSDQSNHSQPEVFSGEEEVKDETPKSPSSPPIREEPSAKLVPAPAPKENAWDKRKTEKSPTAAGTQELKSSKSLSPQTETNKSQPQAPPKGHGDVKKEFVPAEPPKENPWTKRMQQHSKPDGSHNQSTVSIKTVRSKQGIIPIFEAVYKILKISMSVQIPLLRVLEEVNGVEEVELAAGEGEEEAEEDL